MWTRIVSRAARVSIETRTREAPRGVPKRAFAEKPRWKVLFFGTDGVSVVVAELLRKQMARGHVIEKLEVVTVPGIDSASRSDRLEKAVVSREDISSTSLGADRVVWGLKRPLATWAAERSVPIHGPPPGIPFADWTFPPSLWKDFDIAVAVSFGHLIPKHMIEGFKKGGLNVHASLLPKYRGPAPIYHALLEGQESTGVSVITLHPTQFDAGDIVMQKELKIEPSQKYLGVALGLARLGAEALVETLDQLDHVLASSQSQALPHGPRAHAPGGSYAGKVTREMCAVSWQTQNAERVLRQWRALGDTYGVHTFLKGSDKRRIKLIDLEKANASDLDQKAIPGTLVWNPTSKELRVVCAENSAVRVMRLQMEGKRVWEPTDLVNGLHLGDRKKTTGCSSWVIGTFVE